MINCKDCPENQACCGLILFERKFIDKFHNHIENGFSKVTQSGNLVIYFYDDLRCPFLNRQTRLCKIYDSRPKVCRDYGYIDKLQCPHFKKSGNKRSKASQIQIERNIDKQLNRITKDDIFKKTYN